MKSKRLLIIGLTLFVIVVILLVVLEPKKEEKPIEHTPRMIEKPIEHTPRMIEKPSLKLDNEVEYLHEKDIKLDNFKFNFNETTKRYVISFEITNTSEVEVDLNNYSINVLDSDSNILCTIGGSALGKIAAKNKTTSSIEINDDMSKAKTLDFILKK